MFRNVSESTLTRPKSKKAVEQVYRHWRDYLEQFVVHKELNHEVTGVWN